MKCLLSLTAILFCLAANAEDFVFSNNCIVLPYGDSHWIDDTAPIVANRVMDYVATHFDLSYPGSNIYVFNLSHSGGTMDNRITNDIPKTAIGLWGYLSNNFQHVGISLSTDNGALSSNSMVLAQSNVFQAPGLMANANFPLTAQTGWASTHPVQWIGAGYEPAQQADGDPVNELARNNAGTNAGWTLGVRGLDLWWHLSHGWTNDYIANGGTNVQWSTVKPAHFFSGGALDEAIALLKQLTTDTNTATCSVDYAGTINATNHSVVYGLSRQGTSLVFTWHPLRLPFAFDMPLPDGSRTNDCSGAFVLNPDNINAFNFTIAATGLPTGNYNLIIGTTNIGVFTDAQFASGINMFTNMTVGYYASIRRATLDACRLSKNYTDPKTLIPGSAGDHQGLVQYTSNASSLWPASTGDNLIAALTPYAKIAFDGAATEAAAATWVDQTITISPVSTRYVNARIR